MEEKKEKFIATFNTLRGLITLTCASTKIARNTYYYWLRNDAEFRQKAEEILEMQIDLVESKLLDLINSGDTTAVIFYLKTKGKNRGYSEKAIPTGDKGDQNNETDKKSSYKRKIKQISGKIKKILENSGKYSSELDLQIDLTAQLMAKSDTLKEEIFSENHKSVTKEYSREGNEREIISQKEKLYLDYAQKVQSALGKLGMVADQKNKNVGDDGFGSFIDGLKDD